MTPPDRFIELWTDFLEGDLGPGEMAELQTLLESDPRLLDEAVESYQVHRLLGLRARESDDRHEAFVRETLKRLPAGGETFVGGVMRQLQTRNDRPDNSYGWTGIALSLAAVAATLLFAGWLIVNRPTEPPVASIVDISGLSGAVQWTGDGGRVVTDLSNYTSLGGGTIEGLAPDSWIELQFDDGTLVTLSGRSMLTISELESKILHLREGSISAKVAKQPPQRPMIIHTRSATLEVLGTQFKIDAELSSTVLNVHEGKVRVRRLNGGDSVDVLANQKVIAAADQQLQPITVPDSTDRWQCDLDNGPPAWSIGKYLPAQGAQVARIRSVPFVHKTGKDSITLFLTAIPISRSSHEPVVLAEDSEFRVQGRIATEQTVYFGFEVHQMDGTFAGKFITSVEDRKTFEDDGSFELELPVRQFMHDPSLQEKRKEFPPTAAGLVVTACWCFTLHDPSGLEISAIEIVPHGDPSPSLNSPEQ